MGTSKRSQKAARVPIVRNTRNRTRLHKPKLITDPAQSTLQLTNQLRGLGLYAAPTLGDGNCLFRALADQLWGSPGGHLKLRAEVCDWLEARKERYEGFVDEDRSFDTHIQCMRVPGTYGGHLELSAFAHLKRRNVKVIQPGLVYVIEWDCGWGADPPPPPPLVVDEPETDVAGLNERDKRRLRRDQKRHDKERVARQEAEGDEAERSRAVYVAYHDWEHFSSVRNLAGPHAGLPDVVERPERPGRLPDEPPPLSKGKRKAASAGKAKGPATPTNPLPAQIPLPPSRSVSPSTASTSISQPLSQATTSTAPSSLAPLTPLDVSSLAHDGRSPKRTFDETHDASPRASASAKRHKPPPAPCTNAMAVDVDADENTPSLSDESSQSGLASPASSSALSSPSPPTPPEEPEPPQTRLTRRQRKSLGLPHPRPPLSPGKTRSAGKILIPGGRRTRRSAKADEEDVPGEWRTNGTGRLDVRGFRELRI